MLMSDSSFFAASISMCSLDDKSKNIEKAFYYLDKCVKAGVKLALLPEMFSIYGVKDYTPYAESDQSELIEKLSKYAKQNNMYIAGTVPEAPKDSTQNKVYNTLYVFSSDGTILEKYRKTHLFNLIDIDGKPSYCESDTFLDGDTLKTCNILGFNTGLVICYDIRFSSLFSKLSSKKPLDIILAPSAFTLQTGMYHWECILRSRAIEFQSYMIASNQTGMHSHQKPSYGHSQIIDPWGTVLCDTGAKEGLAITEISKERIIEVRNTIPVRDNLRTELY